MVQRKPRPIWPAIALIVTSVSVATAPEAWSQSSGWETDAVPDFSGRTDPTTQGAPTSTGDTGLGGRAQVALQAVLYENGPQINNTLVWRIFRVQSESDGSFDLVATQEEIAPSFDLAAGQYYVNVSYGLAHVTESVTLQPGRRAFRQLVLNAGGLKLAGVDDAAAPLAERSVTFSVFTDERNQFGERQVVAEDISADVLLRLNAGLYHVVSRYGDANATSSADVTIEAGRLTQVTMHHDAARVTLKLVDEPGGEALAGTRWQIFSSAGDLIMTSAGALPTHILAAGRYRISAIREGRRFEAEFDLAAGSRRELEVIRN